MRETPFRKPPRERKELYNVLSLEFSDTKMETLVGAGDSPPDHPTTHHPQVQPPRFVRDIDWIENIWPRELRERQRVYTPDEADVDTDLDLYPKG